MTGAGGVVVLDSGVSGSADDCEDEAKGIDFIGAREGAEDKTRACFRRVSL